MSNINYIKPFTSWLYEAKTEASDDEILKLLGLMVPIIRKSVDDTMRIEMDYAKKIADAKTDNDRSRFLREMDDKKIAAEEPLATFLSARGKVSQTQYDKILSWSKTMKGFLIGKEMATKENDFKNIGVDVSKWKEMYNPAEINNQMLLFNRSFERETGIKPPLVTG